MLALILREALQLVASGLFLGVVGAVLTTRVLKSMVFGVQPGDPGFVAIACGVMVVTGLAAAFVPASRAASVDPMQALRSE